MRNDLVSNKKFTERGFSLGLDKLIIKNLGIRSPSDDMVANTFEAVLGAIYMDAEEDAFAAVRDALEQTGFLHHHLLGGTSPTQSTTAA
jgi:ribonuclease-3